MSGFPVEAMGEIAVAERMLRALPRAERGNRSAQALVRRWLHKWAEFVGYDERRLDDLGRRIGYSIYFEAWDSRIETIALARKANKPFLGIVTHRSGNLFNSYVTMVKQ